MAHERNELLAYWTATDGLPLTYFRMSNYAFYLRTRRRALAKSDLAHTRMRNGVKHFLDGLFACFFGNRLRRSIVKIYHFIRMNFVFAVIIDRNLEENVIIIYLKREMFQNIPQKTQTQHYTAVAHCTHSGVDIGKEMNHNNKFHC